VSKERSFLITEAVNLFSFSVTGYNAQRSTVNRNLWRPSDYRARTQISDLKPQTTASILCLPFTWHIFPLL